VKDADGNVYNIVTIGSMTWMAENLKVTHYSNGTSIPNVTDGTTWGTLESGAYCDYNNTPGIYGKLYNWYSVNSSSGLCPAGWHIPTDYDCTLLASFLGGVGIAGGKLKEVGTAHWQSPNTEATNETGFTALPGGVRSNGGSYSGIACGASWWCSTETGSLINAFIRGVNYNNSNLDRSYLGKNSGLSVRCLKN